MSSLLFVLHLADLEDWLSHSMATTYADDTTSIRSSKRLEELKIKMEEDANAVLKYMTSNTNVTVTQKHSQVLSLMHNFL